MDDLASGGPGTSEGWKRTFETLTQDHKQAFELQEEAETLEKEIDLGAALAKYTECLAVIDRALSLPIARPPNPDLSWERAGVMIQKLQKCRDEINNKVAALQTKASAASTLPSKPPSYEEAVGMGAPKSEEAAAGPSSGDEAGAEAGLDVASAAPALSTYKQLGEALNTLRCAYKAIVGNVTTSNGSNKSQVNEAAGDAEVVFAYDNVRLYFISPDGSVSSSSEPERMIIVHFAEEIPDRPPAYLQVGNWIYPLVPGVSPCFRTSYRAFILPDIHSDIEGAAVGLMLPEDADESVFELLEIILDGITLQIEPETRYATRLRREVGLAHSVVRGARWVSSRLISGAERAGDLMNRGTPKLLQHIEREQPKEFSPNVTKGFEVAKNVSGKAVQVTGYVAGKVGLATSALGRFLAPHIQQQGTRLLTKTFKMEETVASEKMNNILEATAGAVEAFGTVYGALDQSAHILAGSLASNTVSVVQHKYGAQAGQVAGNTFDTVGNVFVAGHAMKRLNPKYVAKSAVKAAGKAVIEDQRKHLQEDTQTDIFAKPGLNFQKSD